MLPESIAEKFQKRDSRREIAEVDENTPQYRARVGYEQEK
jgi:hypothetical protein